MKSLEMSYKLLDLQPGVCFADVKKAFRKKALLCHPDIAGEEYSFQFQQINEAYLALKNALLNKSAVKSPAKSHTKTSGDTKDLLIKKEIENILKEAQEYLSALVKTVGDDCKIKLSDILLRLQSRHPEVRFIAADHLRRLEWEESYMDEPVSYTHLDVYKRQIVGFPGESERAFENTLTLIDNLGIGRVHVFPFSPRKGTKAYSMPERLDKRELESRMDRAINLGRKLLQRFARRWVGQSIEILVEHCDGARVKGLSRHYLEVEACLLYTSRCV